MSRKRLFIVIGTVILVLVISSGIIVSRIGTDSDPEPVTLDLAVGWSDANELNALDSVLRDFNILYPHIGVVTRHTDDPKVAGDGWYAGADVIIRSGPTTAGSGLFAEPPVAWTGTLWVLAARKEILDSISTELPAEVDALRAGSAAPEIFTNILSRVKAGGFTPITLGNSHRWPFILWLQHWTAATAGPQAVSELPSPPYPALSAAFSDLMRWKRDGWFAESVWNEGWAGGYGPIDTGTAAFALVSARYLSAISQKTRGSLEYLPFPGGSGDDPWSIGQSTYIGIGSDSKDVKAAALLVHYLTSPGITGRLSALSGKPFFAWDERTGRYPTVLAGWEEAALTPAYERIKKEFDPGK